MELILLNECTECLSACGQCKFDVDTDTHSYTHTHNTDAHTCTHSRKSDRPISPGKFGTKSTLIYKGRSIHRFESVWQCGTGTTSFMHSGRQCGFVGTTTGWLTSWRIVSDSSWLDKSARLSAPQYTYAQ